MCNWRTGDIYDNGRVLCGVWGVESRAEERGAVVAGRGVVWCRGWLAINRQLCNSPALLTSMEGRGASAVMSGGGASGSLCKPGP